MKKLTALFLSLAMVLGLTACSSTSSSSSESGTSESHSEGSEVMETPSSLPESTESSTETSTETGKTLVVYFPPPEIPSRRRVTSRTLPAATCLNWSPWIPIPMRSWIGQWMAVG